MEAGTWVALIIGVLSLLLTLTLDRRNREERTETGDKERGARADQAERDRKEREAAAERELSRSLDERWLQEKHSAYSAFSGLLYGWFDEATGRTLQRALGLTPEASEQADRESFQLALTARGRLDLVAPESVRSPAVDAINQVLLYAGSTREGDVRAEHGQRDVALASLVSLVAAMRADLGIRDPDPDAMR